MNATSISDPRQRKQELSVSFDPVGYDPSEWEKLFTDIDTALEREGLPSLHGERWQPLDFGFEFTGGPDDVFRIKAVLEQFAMRVYLDGGHPGQQPFLPKVNLVTA